MNPLEKYGFQPLGAVDEYTQALMASSRVLTNEEAMEVEEYLMDEYEIRKDN
jgi:hypothetical protein